MENQQFLLDAFNTYYNNGMEAKNKNNIPLAKKNFTRSAEALVKLAKMSSGELRKSRYERASRLIDFINTLQEPKTNANIISNSNSNASKKTSKEDSSETIWEAVSVPKIGFEDIAGLDEVKEAVRARIILPRKHPEVYQKYKKKSGGGVLMYGLPGTGKTMISKAIAKEINAKFFEVKSSDIVSKWFGEAEKNIKSLFETARKEKSAVIFFDEFEAMGAKRGGNSSVMARIIPELLAQIQGFNETDSNIMLLAATNRPWDIDSAFLRPGRFNEKLYIPLPDYEARKFIVTKALEELPIDADINIDDIVTFTDGFNASDVVEFCERLKDGPIKRTIESGGNNIKNITAEDVSLTKAKVKSSVNPQDVVTLENWKDKYEDNNY